MTDQHFALFDTRIGLCAIAWGPRGINGTQLPMGGEEKIRTRINQRHPEASEAEPTAEVQQAIDRMTKLLAGEPDDLTDIPLDLDGVPDFNRGVYEIARAIPPGKTITYGDIAKRLGGVELSRDVGQALGREVTILVPSEAHTARVVENARTMAIGAVDADLGLNNGDPRAAERKDWIARDVGAAVTINAKTQPDVVAAVAGLGIAALPDDLIDDHLQSGALMTVMAHHPPPPAGIYVVRPPGRHPARKVRVLTDMLIACFDRDGVRGSS